MEVVAVDVFVDEEEDEFSDVVVREVEISVVEEISDVSLVLKLVLLTLEMTFVIVALLVPESVIRVVVTVVCAGSSVPLDPGYLLLRQLQTELIWVEMSPSEQSVVSGYGIERFPA